MPVCAEAELNTALDTFNQGLAPQEMSRGCSIALGANLILNALAGLDEAARAETTMWLVQVLLPTSIH